MNYSISCKTKKQLYSKFDILKANKYKTFKFYYVQEGTRIIFLFLNSVCIYIEVFNKWGLTVESFLRFWKHGYRQKDGRYTQYSTPSLVAYAHLLHMKLVHQFSLRKIMKLIGQMHIHLFGTKFGDPPLILIHFNREWRRRINSRLLHTLRTSFTSYMIRFTFFTNLTCYILSLVA